MRALARYLLGLPPAAPANARRPDELTPPPWNPSGTDPALLTHAEWSRLVDPTGRRHGDDAFDWDVEELARRSRDEYPHLLQQVTRGGLRLEVRYGVEALSYARDPDEIARGMPTLLTAEEAAARGAAPRAHSFAVFDRATCVGVAEDEWGCWLVVVAREYRELGLGELLFRIAAEHDPARASGGFSGYGRAGFRRAHRAIVREALAAGRYSRLVRAGQLTAARAAAIVASVGLPAASGPPPPDLVLARNDPAAWHLLATPAGHFVLYDPTAASLDPNGERFEHFLRRAVKGAAASADLGDERRPGGAYALLTLFGGETPAIRRLLLRLVFSDVAPLPLYLDPEDEADVDPAVAAPAGPADFVSGFRRRPYRLRGAPLDVAGLGVPERRWRARTDPYGEFEARLLETADAKFRPAR